MSEQQFTVPASWNGPAHSGNGGITCASLAHFLGRSGAGDMISVRLRQPPPLDTPLTVRCADGSACASGPAGVVGEASVVKAVDVLAGPATPAVDFAQARQAGTRFPGLVAHPFPTCVVCGVERDPQDGLCLRTGFLAGSSDTTATAWTPTPVWAADDGRVTSLAVWAALDCPGGWSVDIAGRPMVLGTMSASVSDRPHVGDECVVMGRAVRTHGRKAWTETALYAGTRLLARAAAVWIAIDPAAVAPAGS